MTAKWIVDYTILYYISIGFLYADIKHSLRKFKLFTIELITMSNDDGVSIGKASYVQYTTYDALPSSSVYELHI